MGDDSQWFSKFMDAFFDSFAATELPIWRVFKVEPDGAKTAVTSEDGWDATWKQITALQARDPDARYQCNHSISY